MTFEAFQEFIEEQDILLHLLNKQGDPQREILARTVKISEEFGELCDEVLSSMGDQRKGKLANHKDTSLGDEFADVIITTFLLAKRMDVDVMNVLDGKIKKIREKHNKEL